MFKVNEKVVYPGHGVAIVENVDEKTVSGNVMTFYKLNFLYKDMTILVPIHSLMSIGVRYLAKKEEIEILIKELQKEPQRPFGQIDLSPSGWNKRNKEYHARIQSGTFKNLISIYSDLMHIGMQKELSFGEKGLLQSTEDLIVQEIIEVLGTEKSLILQDLRLSFKQLVHHVDIDQHQNPSSL